MSVIIIFLILTNIFSIFLFIHTHKKLIAQVILFNTYLDIVKQNGRRKYKSTVVQKIIIAKLFKFLKYPEKLCYLFKPETILKWYRIIVKKFWTFPFKKKSPGRPPINDETIQLILQLKRENINWGCRRIHGELKKLNISVCKSKIAEILVQYGLDPSDYGLTWSKFLKSHIESIFAMDFKIVTTIFGITYYVMFFISHKSRKIMHYSVTAHPTNRWIRQQLRNFIFDFDKKIYLIRDNDQLFKHVDFEMFVNIEDIPISYHAPNMNAFVERFIGSFVREALGNFIIFSEKQLNNIVKEYVTFYNNYRPHQGIGNIPLSQINDNEIKIYSKTPSKKIKKKSFLCGILNHYYIDESA